MRDPGEVEADSLFLFDGQALGQLDRSGIETVLEVHADVEQHVVGPHVQGQHLVDRLHRLEDVRPSGHVLDEGGIRGLADQERLGPDREHHRGRRPVPVPFDREAPAAQPEGEAAPRADGQSRRADVRRGRCLCGHPRQRDTLY